MLSKPKEHLPTPSSQKEKRRERQDACTARRGVAILVPHDESLDRPGSGRRACVVVEPGLNAFDKGRACATAENSARGAGNLIHHRVFLSVYGCAKQSGRDSK